MPRYHAPGSFVAGFTTESKRPRNESEDNKLVNRQRKRETGGRKEKEKESESESEARRPFQAQGYDDSSWKDKGTERSSINEVWH